MSPCEAYKINSSPPYIGELEKLIVEHRYKKAEWLAQNLLANHPESAPLHLAYARLLNEEGKVSEAIEEYLKVRELDLNDLQSCLALYHLYSQNLDIENSIKYARLAVGLQPDSPSAKIAFISMLIENGLFNAAGEELTNLLSQNKTNPDVLLLAYKLNRKKGDLDKAKYYLEKTITYSGHPSKYELELSDLLEQMRNYQGAKECLERVLRKQPNNTVARLKLANNLEFYFYDFDKAMNEYKEVQRENGSAQAAAGIKRCQQKSNDLALRLKLWFKKL